MSLEREDIRTALKNKGFREKLKGDHDRYWLYVGEKQQAIFTKLSRGARYRTYGDDLVQAVAKQLKMTKPILRKFVECTVSEADYLQHLRESGVVLSE